MPGPVLLRRKSIAIEERFKEDEKKWPGDCGRLKGPNFKPSLRAAETYELYEHQCAVPRGRGRYERKRGWVNHKNRKYTLFQDI
jgi:hypothetical protein